MRAQMKMVDEHATVNAIKSEAEHQIKLHEGSSVVACQVNVGTVDLSMTITNESDVLLLENDATNATSLTILQ